MTFLVRPQVCLSLEVSFAVMCFNGKQELEFYFFVNAGNASVDDEVVLRYMYVMKDIISVKKMGNIF